MLERLGRSEGLANRFEAETVPVLRQALADKYSAIVGIHPSQRTQLREALECIRSGSRQTIAILRELLNADQSRNGTEGSADS